MNEGNKLCVVCKETINGKAWWTAYNDGPFCCENEADESFQEDSAKYQEFGLGVYQA